MKVWLLRTSEGGSETFLDPNDAESAYSEYCNKLLAGISGAEWENYETYKSCYYYDKFVADLELLEMK